MKLLTKVKQSAKNSSWDVVGPKELLEVHIKWAHQWRIGDLLLYPEYISVQKQVFSWFAPDFRWFSNYANVQSLASCKNCIPSITMLAWLAATEPAAMKCARWYKYVTTMNFWTVEVLYGSLEYHSLATARSTDIRNCCVKCTTHRCTVVYVPNALPDARCSMRD
jgi:hypothetical protein